MGVDKTKIKTKVKQSVKIKPKKLKGPVIGKKMDINRSNEPVINTGITYPLKELRSDGYTNTFWELPNKKMLKELNTAGDSSARHPRKLYEISKPDIQCDKVTGPATGKCYICDIIMKNLSDAGFGQGGKVFEKTGRQCEHIIPVLIMAIICGLRSTKNIKYENTVFSKYKKYAQHRGGYLKWRNIVWEKGYKWSHTECNMIKNENPFIKVTVDFTKTPIVNLEYSSQRPDRTNINIKKLFRMLLQKKGPGAKWCGMWRYHYKTEAISEINGHSDTEGWIDEKFRKLHTEYLEPLTRAIKYSGGDDGQSPPTPKEYFNISILILKETILDRLLNKPTEIKFNKVLKVGKLIGLFNSAYQVGGAGEMDLVETDDEMELEEPDDEMELEEPDEKSEINIELENEIISSIKNIDNGLFSDEMYNDEKDSISTAILLMNLSYPTIWNDLKNIIMEEGEFSDGSAKKLLINEIFLSLAINKDTGDTYYQFIPGKIKDELIDIKNLVKDKDDKRFLDAVVSSIEEVYEGSHIHAGSKSKKYKTKRPSKRKKKKKSKKSRKKKSKGKSIKKSLSRLLGSIFSY